MSRLFRRWKIRIPSESVIERFALLKASFFWKSIPSDWRCPSCGRSKVEIIRFSSRTREESLLSKCDPTGLYWWKCPLHFHHDHGNRWKGTYLLCGDCNAADGIAKKELRLPKDWSFSPDELHEFVQCDPHGSIRSIDLDVALEIFLSSQELETPY